MGYTSLSTPLLASDYENHWAKEAIERWQDKGVVNGYEDGTFKPKQAITRAELAKIIVEIFGLSNTSRAAKYADVAEDAWYDSYVAAVSSAGIMNDNGDKFNPNAYATREEAAYAIAMAYKVAGGNASFKDSDDISTWAAEKVGALANGYVSGRNDGKFAPKDSLTRADVITMIDKITADLVNAPGTYTKDIKGNLVVKSGDVVLKDMVVDGNLYIAEGVGEGDVTLDNVKVKGTIFLEGAGENSFKLINGSSLGTVKVSKANGKPVRIYQDKSCLVEQVDITSGCILEGEGKFNTVNVQEKSEVQIKAATITTLNIKVEASIKTSSGAVIANLVCDAKVTLTGNGKITDCKINVTGCKLSVTPKNTAFASNEVKVTIGSKEYSTTNIKEANNNSSSNNGSSDSSSSSNNSSSSGNSSSNPTPSNPTPSNPEPSNPEPSNPTPNNPTINLDPVKEQTKEEVKESKKQVTKVDYQNKWVVPQGTTTDAVMKLLPNTVSVNYNDGTFGILGCKWTMPNSIENVGEYTINGDVEVPSDVQDGDWSKLELKLNVEKQQLMAPVTITNTSGKAYVEYNQPFVTFEVAFPQKITTPGTIYVQMGEAVGNGFINKGEERKSVSVDISKLPAGQYIVSAWFENEEKQQSSKIQTNITKLKPSQVPTSINGIDEFEQALIKATDEVLQEVTLPVTNITSTQVDNYSISNNQILSSRLNGIKLSQKVDADGDVLSMTIQFIYKTMFEASKAYKELQYRDKISNKAQQVLEAAERVIAERIELGMTPSQKEKVIHDYIVLHTAYSKNNSENVLDPIYGAEGVLLGAKGDAVCQGYAEAMKLFMDMLDIPCEVVTGSNLDKSVRHAWNLIQLEDNEWYHVDATWDDPTPDEEGRIQYAYYNVTDKMIKEDHIIDENKNYPAANGERFFYYADNKVGSEEAFAAKIDDLLSNGRYKAEVYCDFNVNQKNLKEILSKAFKNHNANGKYSSGMQGKVFSYQLTPDNQAKSIQEFEAKVNELLSDYTCEAAIYCDFEANADQLRGILLNGFKNNAMNGNYIAGMQGKVFSYKITLDSKASSESEFVNKVDELFKGKTYKAVIYCDFNADLDKLTEQVKAIRSKYGVNGTLSCTMNGKCYIYEVK